MTDKEHIKQEIERRIDNLSYLIPNVSNIDKLTKDDIYCFAKSEALKSILQFIDSLPDCTTCVNDKGCVTCENGELHESAGEDLKESARYYLLNNHVSPLNDILHQADLKVEMQYHKDIENAFKAGAEWQKQQMYKLLGEQITLNYNSGYEKGLRDKEEEMMKILVGGEIVKDIHNQLCVKSEPLNDTFGKFGDKVKIIIVKGD